MAGDDFPIKTMIPGFGRTGFGRDQIYPDSGIKYPLVNKHRNGKSQFLMGKSTISMAIFNSKLLVHQRVADFSNKQG